MRRAAAARRRADGPAHAGARRHRGHAQAAGEQPAVRVIALTTFDDRRGRVRRAPRGRGRLPAQGRSSARLVEAVLAAARGESVLQPSVAAKVVAGWRALPDEAVAAPAPARRAAVGARAGRRRGCSPKAAATGRSPRTFPRRRHRQEPRDGPARQARRARPHPGRTAGPRPRPALIVAIRSGAGGVRGASESLQHLGPAEAVELEAREASKIGRHAVPVVQDCLVHRIARGTVRSSWRDLARRRRGRRPPPRTARRGRCARPPRRSAGCRSAGSTWPSPCRTAAASRSAAWSPAATPSRVWPSTIFAVLRRRRRRRPAPPAPAPRRRPGRGWPRRSAYEQL